MRTIAMLLFLMFAVPASAQTRVDTASFTIYSTADVERSMREAKPGAVACFYGTVLDRKIEVDSITLPTSARVVDGTIPVIGCPLETAGSIRTVRFPGDQCAFVRDEEKYMIGETRILYCGPGRAAVLRVIPKLNPGIGA